MPYEQINMLFSDLYGYEINSGTIESMLKEACEKGAGVEQENKQAVSASPVAHFDETGLRVTGKTHWMHTAVTEIVSYYFVPKKRGKIALASQQSVYAAYKGWAIHDCFATYFQNLQAKHRLCNAHLVRELEGLLEVGSQCTKDMQAFLWRLYEKSRSAKLTVNEMADVRKEYLAIL
jgi:transposase